MATEHIDSAVGIERAAVCRHIIREIAVLHNNRDIVLGLFRHGGQRGKILIILCPVAVHQDSAAAEIGLGRIHMRYIAFIDMVGITAGNLNSVILGRTSQDGLLTFQMEQIRPVERNCVFEQEHLVP